MRILELCTSPGVGGLELYVVRSVAALHAAGYDVLALVRPDTLLHQRHREASLPFRTLPRRSRLLPLVAAWRLARMVERERIDIVHMHWGHDLFLAALAKRLCRRPFRLVYTRQMALTRAKDDAYHRFLYRAVDLYLTITDKLADQARAWLPLAPDRVLRLYYGVAEGHLPAGEERHRLRSSLGIGEGAFAVGLIGRIEEQKGQHLLVEAVRLLREGGFEVEADIIGPVMDERYRDSLARTIREAGLEGTVRLHPPHKSPMTIMPAFDAVLLATRMETFGLVLAEAMRCGVAVIGSDAGGVPEIIEEGVTGLLFPPDDAQALAGRIRRLIESPADRERLAAAGKKRADELFSEERHYRRLGEIFTALASGGRAGSAR